MFNICFLIAGNPFKIDKRMMVDEADIDMVGATSSASKGGMKRALTPSEGGVSPALRPPPNKRKPGPIPKDVTVKRPSKSPSSSASNSPIPWHEDVKPPNLILPNSSVINNANSDISSALSSPYPSSPEKLVNGISEILMTPIFEPISVEPLTNHSDIPPILTPIVNNVDSIKHEVKTERTENVDIMECIKLTVNDCVVDNQNSVIVKCVTDEPLLTNHVEEKREKEKIEKEQRPLTKKEIEDIRKHNLSVRELVYKEVRRKGTSK